jgi:hypothetical protein
MCERRESDYVHVRDPFEMWRGHVGVCLGGFIGASVFVYALLLSMMCASDCVVLIDECGI